MSLAASTALQYHLPAGAHMLQHVYIQNFKSLTEETVGLKPLTVLSGKNSAGKSTVIQAILLLARNCNKKNQRQMYDLVSKFSDADEVANRYTPHQDFFLSAAFSNGETIAMHADHTGMHVANETNFLCNEDGLYYLQTNRMGQESIARYSKEYKVGDNGEFLFGTYERMRHTKVLNIAKFDDVLYHNFAGKNVKKLLPHYKYPYHKYSNTKMPLPEADVPMYLTEGIINSFDFQMNYWLGRILEASTSLVTEKVTTDQIKVTFYSNGLAEINPFNLGAGTSFLAKILILCLLARKDDTVIIENPEIHLHPAAQSRLGTFFCFLARSGVQCIIETHSDHLINGVRLAIKQKKWTPEQTAVHFFVRGHQAPTTMMTPRIDADGRIDVWPEGFFDEWENVLAELL